MKVGLHWTKRPTVALDLSYSTSYQTDGFPNNSRGGESPHTDS